MEHTGDCPGARRERPQAGESEGYIQYGQLHIQLHYEAQGKGLADLLRDYFLRQRRG